VQARRPQHEWHLRKRQAVICTPLAPAFPALCTGPKACAQMQTFCPLVHRCKLFCPLCWSSSARTHARACILAHFDSARA
jgi:hypothetical protein